VVFEIGVVVIVVDFLGVVDGLVVVVVIVFVFVCYVFEGGHVWLVMFGGKKVELTAARGPSAGVATRQTTRGTTPTMPRTTEAAWHAARLASRPSLLVVFWVVVGSLVCMGSGVVSGTVGLVVIVRLCRCC